MSGFEGGRLVVGDGFSWSRKKRNVPFDERRKEPDIKELDANSQATRSHWHF
jgi:hypothetical protein